LPELQGRKEELGVALEKEQARQVELAECDQEHLAGLREAISEQKYVSFSNMRTCLILWAALKSRTMHAKTPKRKKLSLELNRGSNSFKLKSKIYRLASQLLNRSYKEPVPSRKRLCISSEVGHSLLYYKSDKPIDEFQSLQEVQSWRLVQFNGKEVKVVHCEEICAVLSVAQTGIKRLELSLFENEQEPAFQKNIKAFLFDRMKMLLEQGQKEGVYVDVPVRSIVPPFREPKTSAGSIAQDHSHVGDRFSPH
jgi:hypothetical protein